MEEYPLTQLEQYEISPYTLAIMPITYGFKTYSRIIEFSDELLVPYKPLEVVKTSCIYFGSDFTGRCAGTRQLIGISHKVPIPIDPANSILFFPTISPERSECIWIAYKHVAAHRRLNSKSTLITFRNKQSITIPVSYSVVNNQLLRTSNLQSKLLEKMEDTERKNAYLYNLIQVSENRPSIHSQHKV